MGTKEGTADELQSYRDHLEPGESLPAEVERFCQSLETQGWGVHVRRGSLLRYWCGCHKQCETWVTITASMSLFVQEDMQMLERKSCFTL